MKVKLKDIQVANLDTRTVLLLARFVRLARESEGADLLMQQPDIVKRVFVYADSVNNPDLLVLFMRIRQNIVNQIRRSSEAALAA